MLKAAKLFQPGMVVQKGKLLKIWGEAEPFAEVAVRFQGMEERVRTDEYGKWSAALPSPEYSEGEELLILSGKEILRIPDILVGEVWVAAGQSNMEFWMRYEKYYRQGDGFAENPRIRFFDVPKIAYAGQDQDFDYDRVGRWRNAAAGEIEYFSAVGYYFARELERRLDVPVGIIGCNWGGTECAAWMSRESAKRTGCPGAESFTGLPDGIGWEEYRQIQRENPLNDKGNPFGDAFTELMLPRTPSEEEIRAFFQAHPMPPQTLPQSQTLPGTLFTHMVKPTAPFSIRGVLWYQGESDNGMEETSRYTDMLTALIGDWRAVWEDPCLPFLVVQLPGWESWWGAKNMGFAGIRKSQEEVADREKEVYLCSISDVGERFDIHPKDKKIVGERLALLALGHVYGQSILCDAPKVLKAFREGQKIQVSFANAQGGLFIRGERLAALEITAKGRPVPFQAFVCGEELMIRLLDDNGEPLRLAFAQTGWYRVNLYNRSGIPAIPFAFSI